MSRCAAECSRKTRSWFAPSMLVYGRIAHESSESPAAIRIGSTASSIIPGPLFEFAPDAELFSISQRWITQGSWKFGSARKMSAALPRNLPPLPRGNWGKGFRTKDRLPRPLDPIQAGNEGCPRSLALATRFAKKPQRTTDLAARIGIRPLKRAPSLAIPAPRRATIASRQVRPR